MINFFITFFTYFNIQPCAKLRLMAKVVIFDFGGVLVSESDAFDSDYLIISKKTGLPPYKLQEIFFSHWPKMKIGKESVYRFWQDVKKISKTSISTRELDKIYCKNIKLDKNVLKIINKLKQKDFKLIALSNETKEWMGYKIKKFSLNKVFEKIYCSAFLGMAKPDEKIFKFVLADLKTNPKEILFVDNQENNVVAAKKLEISSILFKNAENLRSELSVFLDNKTNTIS